MGQTEWFVLAILLALGGALILGMTTLAVWVVALRRFYRRERERGLAGLRRVSRVHGGVLAAVWLGAFAALAFRAPELAVPRRSVQAVRAACGARAAGRESPRVHVSALPQQEPPLLSDHYYGRAEGGVVLDRGTYASWFHGYRTRVFIIAGDPSAPRARVLHRFDVPGAVASAVPTTDGIALLYPSGLGRASIAFHGRDGALRATRTVPLAGDVHSSRLVPDEDGGAYVASAHDYGHRVRVEHAHPERPTETILASEIQPYGYHGVDIVEHRDHLSVVAHRDRRHTDHAWAIELASGRIERPSLWERAETFGVVRIAASLLAFVLTLLIASRVWKARAAWRSRRAADTDAQLERAYRMRLDDHLIFAGAAATLLLPALLAPAWHALWASFG